jgi:hypothetical protein
VSRVGRSLHASPNKRRHVPASNTARIRLPSNKHVTLPDAPFVSSQIFALPDWKTNRRSGHQRASLPVSRLVRLPSKFWNPDRTRRRITENSRRRSLLEGFCISPRKGIVGVPSLPAAHAAIRISRARVDLKNLSSCASSGSRALTPLFKKATKVRTYFWT